MKTSLTHNFSTKNIQDIVNLFEKGQLNLNPGFQRKSVWKDKDRCKLIGSVLDNYPLPAIFLFCNKDEGKVTYDVIDGKQRLESILIFMGLLRGYKRFPVKKNIDESAVQIDWNYLKRKNQQADFLTYKIYTIEVDGDLVDIIELFVRINSTGTELTAAEKQHAKYFNSPFLKTASALATKYKDYFEATNIISAGQTTRMKNVELICELMLSVGCNDVINKKATIERVMGKGLSAPELIQYKIKTIQAINRVKQIFPNLNETRFNKISDFYILVVLIAKYEDEKLILIDKKRNQLAQNILKEFSNGVDAIRDKQKRMTNYNEEDSLYREYHLTVTQATDEISQRRKRLTILDSLFRNLFAVKDNQRGFSKEQRRLIWNSSEEKKCKECGVILTWENFTVDHIDPHSRGGKTERENAALLCRKHNSAKGNRIK